ncbi:enoyl-CoA hydratase/isomerase family protein [Kiloniella laminariae]|uniref:enoyl-CoA hydratase/isomerase family protein n=1 Tax=Kiloniella laminariae TaxID=454162 RepID=UPI00036C0111|nr:enoyl-CoA hydratase/isomerase family protein [Kiloniella laminariae]
MKSASDPIDGLVSLVREGKIALVTIDNPPVNATSHAVRSGLVAAAEEIDRDPAIQAVVLICAGRTFIAGADITEFNKPPVEPILSDVIPRLEQSSKVWIAAIHGTALGGGLEVALGCHYRLAVATAKFGFPEVNLGLIPGAGGTVRLPRLIATRPAMEMISTGKIINAEDALAWGLLDKIIPDEPEITLREQALAFAKALLKKNLPLPLSQRPASAPLAAGDLESLKRQITEKKAGQLAPVEALAAVQEATTLSAAEALLSERERFNRLKQGEQSKALRYIFFAEKALFKQLKPTGISDLSEGNSFLHDGLLGQRLMAAYNRELRSIKDDIPEFANPSQSEQKDFGLLADLMVREATDTTDETRQMIITRLLLTLQSEGQKLVTETPDLTNESIDAVLVSCFAFPRWRGGPMYLQQK